MGAGATKNIKKQIAAKLAAKIWDRILRQKCAVFCGLCEAVAVLQFAVIG